MGEPTRWFTLWLTPCLVLTELFHIALHHLPYELGPPALINVHLDSSFTDVPADWQLLYADTLLS